MKKILGIFLLIALFSCKETPKAKVDSGSTQVTKPNVKLYTFDGGSVQVNNLQLFSLDSAYHGQKAILPSPYYVISHPKGNLMWDAGITEDLISSGPLTVEAIDVVFSRNEYTNDQLKSIGMDLDDIDYIALSHYHSDHTGHANLLKNSTWLVQENEYDLIISEDFKKRNMDRFNEVKELTKVRKLQGDFDVFGDSTVVIKFLPGHTIGHQVLFIDLADTGPVLLSGDLYHIKENREHRRMPVFNLSVKQTLESMNAFESFAKEKNAKVIIQHELEDFKLMPKAPMYLK